MTRKRSSDSNRKGSTTGAPVETRRVDHLAEIVDQCTEAKRVADTIGERFLAYLLAMAIQETRTAMRLEITTRSRASAEPRDG